jgi:GMP synthase-like glutamine amidotransferase
MLRIIQNDPDVPPGNITENLHQFGIPYSVHHSWQDNPLPDLLDITALIVLGGAMGANDDQRHPFLKPLKIFIRKVVEQQIPYLGICLGGQLLAAACGGNVESKRWEELGTLAVDLTNEGKSDRLFSGIGDKFTTFQWHHDSFDIPPDAVLLASSPACPHQAFRIGSCAWGTQFHPEVTEEIIRNWCAWDPQTRERSDELVAEWEAATCYSKTARQMLGNFLRTI